MRKVLSFVLVLSLVLGSLGMAFATMPDVAGEDYEDAVNVLAELGVVSGYPDGTYRPDNIVTRAEMAVFVVRALGLADFATGTSSFKDMAGHWSNPYVAYATSLGIIDGYTDGTFRPDRTVSYDEAAKMLVAALGYTPESLAGTWPANYVSKAKVLGILEGVATGSGGANRGDIATMVFQTLDCEVGMVDKDGKWEAIVKAGGGADTMLLRLGAEVRGVTTANPGGTPFIVQGGEDSVINLRPYVGAFVTVYENSKKDIIAVKEVKTTFLTGKRLASGKFKADGVEYNLTFGPQADYFYNGVKATTVSGVTADALYTFAAEVSGKTISKVHSVLEWDVTDHGYFSDDEVAEIKNDKKLFGIAFDKDTSNNIDGMSYALFGATSLADIDEDNVVYVYADASKLIRKIEVGTEVVKGTVTRLAGTGGVIGDLEMTVNGKVYTFADQQGNDNVVPTKAGDEVTLYLDFAGDVYEYVKAKGSADNYAVVLDFVKGEVGFAGKKAQINLFLADGTEKAFAVDEEEVGTNLIDASRVWTTTASSVMTAGSIIKYGVDKDGVLNVIKTFTQVDMSAGKTVSANGTYDMAEIKNDAVIFTIDKIANVTTLVEAKKAKNYGVAELKDILDTEGVKSYYVKEDGAILAMLLEMGSKADDVYGVVLDRGLNNGAEGYDVTVLVDKTETKYDAKVAAYNTASNEDALYKLVFSASNNVLSSIEAQAAVASATSGAGLKLSGNILTVTTVSAVTSASAIMATVGNGETITLSKDVVVYKWNGTDSVYGSGSKTDIAKANIVLFFDVNDTPDGIVDFVLVK